MDRPLITVIGSLNIDLITRIKRVPTAGETLLTQSYNTGCGGKGANQAVACARLSRNNERQPGAVDVHMVGAVGHDAFGKELVDSLRRNGVDTSNVEERQGQQTGVAIIIVEEDTGDNRILVSPNANFALRPERFKDFGTPSTKSYWPSLIVLQLEIPLDTTLQILKAAHMRGLEVLLNPAPAQVLPPETFVAVTHLIVNESEAAIITRTADASSSGTFSKATVKQLLALGVPHIIVTLGSKGVLYIDTNKELIYELEAEKVEVKDTTAAGDTFVGAYATAIARHAGNGVGFEKARAAICWANRAAALTVQREGAQNAIPWLEEVTPNEVASVGTTRSIEEWLGRK